MTCLRLCRGGARSRVTVCNSDCIHHRLSSLTESRRGTGRERTGGRVGRGTGYLAKNALHPGTRPGQPAIEALRHTNRENIDRNKTLKGDTLC